MSSDKSNPNSAGGKARALKLTPEERKDISMKGVEARRLRATLPKATHGSNEHPLKIGSIEIGCYVLEDGTRVLSQRGLQTGIGMSLSGGKAGEQRVATFLESLRDKGIEINDLAARIKNPLRFLPKSGGRDAYGYEATILADICDVVLSARNAGMLLPSQKNYADQCEILVRGFARVGIVALIDEATGYQKDRAKNDLAKILANFVAKELQPYMKAFPSDYYENLFRLRKLPYPPEVINFRPQYFGKLTNDIVYERMAPGLLAEMKRLAQKDEKKAHLHRRLTQELGHPKLREHLASVVTIMKLSNDYADFINKMNMIHPRFGDNLMLDLDEPDR